MSPSIQLLNEAYHTFNGDLDGCNKIFDVIMKQIDVTTYKISDI